MELKSDQEAALRKWVSDGADLGEIQSRLESEFEIRITYMDTRFLLGDLDLALVEEEEPEPEAPATDAEIVEQAVAAATPPTPESKEADAKTAPQELEVAADGDAPPSPSPEGEPAGGNVSITVDKLTIPGAAVSGSATFSDGKSAKWYLDQMGQLGFEPETPGYRPPESDLEAFQNELSKALQKAGF